jgi:hypothetical protein
MQAYIDREAKASLCALLERCHPAEVTHLLDQLRAGRLDGHDAGACLIGHIASYRGSGYEACGLSRADTWPMECWLWDVQLGDTPETHAQARQLEGWLVEWLEAHTLEIKMENIYAMA